jgi:hypothetical protein
MQYHGTMFAKEHDEREGTRGKNTTDEKNEEGGESRENGEE